MVSFKWRKFICDKDNYYRLSVICGFLRCIGLDTFKKMTRFTKHFFTLINACSSTVAHGCIATIDIAVMALAIFRRFVDAKALSRLFKK
ncbi:hypothetical protein PSYJA_13000 [Pseudomonas syringae pv. japonica str. M301072]|uniref:Uncharacterized protein n=1 Tax=Pseudomonas syringae pv. japonica str. M301072 TaxID=629262 RepID=F3FHZ3_PSESX|nr:hypothetical protein PSYJA_13000 [Pseudomonas syringae pv. japonica str. M301072]